MRIVGSAFFVIGGHNILGCLATAKSEAAAENEGNAAQRSELPATYRGGGFSAPSMGAISRVKVPNRPAGGNG